MAFKGFQMVPEVSMHKILYVSKTLYMLQKAFLGFQSVEWTLSMTIKTKLTSYYAQRSANNCLFLSVFLWSDELPFI